MCLVDGLDCTTEPTDNGLRICTELKKASGGCEAVVKIVYRERDGLHYKELKKLRSW